MASQDTPDPASDRPDVLVVGAASRDLAPDDERGWRLGGATTYCSLTLARLGFRVRALVGVDREAARAHELSLLHDAGVEVALVALAHGPVFDNIEGPRGRTQLCLSVADELPRAALPSGWESASAMLLGPVAAELGADWVDVARHVPLVALGWQGLLRELEVEAVVRRRAPAPSPLLRTVSLAVMHHADVLPGTRLDDLVRLLGDDATLVITDGGRGGLVVRSGAPARIRRYPAIPADAEVDPTGAGDVFLAALLAARLAPTRLGGRPGTGSDLRLAAAAASLSVEAPGLAGVPTLRAVVERARRPPAIDGGTDGR